MYFLVPAMLACPAAAYAFDCTAVKATNVPYQLTLLKNGTNSYPVQIYRGADLTRRQSSMENDHVFVAEFQANFQLENHGNNGENISIVYSIPTNKYIWTQDTRVVHGKSLIDGKPAPGRGFEAIYAMLPDETIVLGDCSFPVKHYTVQQGSQSIDMTSDVLFSPELNTFLRMTVSTLVVSTGKRTQTKLEARYIETEFTPFR